jgi:hypothetical protein
MMCLPEAAFTASLARVKAKLGEVFEAEIVFGEVPIQVLFAAVLMDAAHTPLKDPSTELVG